MTVTGGSSLPKDEVDRMRQEAEQYAEEDHKRRETAETRNRAEQLVYQTEALIRDNPDTIPADAREETEAALAEVKEKLKGDDAAAIRDATDRAAQAAQKIGTAMYAKARAEGGQAPGEPPPAGSQGASQGGTQQDDDVVDAEIVDDEDDRG
jgi:molecular chaperone DnaK